MTPQGPFVSIIMLAYNRERSIGECLRSVLARTCANREQADCHDLRLGGHPSLRVPRFEVAGHQDVRP
jgi:hypothetical protein